MNTLPPEPPIPPDQPTEPTRRVPREVVAPRPAVERIPPEEVAVERRWENPWPALLAGLLALIVGGALGYAVGHNSRTDSTQTVSRSPVTQTVNHTTTVVHPKVLVHTVTSRTVTQAPASPSPASEERTRTIEENLRKLERENEALREGKEG